MVHSGKAHGTSGSHPSCTAGMCLQLAKAAAELDMTDILTEAVVVSSVNINQQNIADDHN